MPVPFCKKCRKLLTIKEDKNIIKAVCECGYELDSAELSSTEKKKIEIVGSGLAKEIKTSGFQHKCKKCGYEECDIFHLNPFYSDESDIYLYRCKKCGYTQRDTYGTSNK